MTGNRISVLRWVLGSVTVALVGGWLAASWIESPADVAARTAPPTPSPILVPVEKRVLSSTVVTRGTGRFGLPIPIAIAPSTLKPTPGLITTLPLLNAPIEEGGVMLTASGRPLWVLRGAIPAFRDLVPSLAGDDVRQLEEGLARLGFDPGAVDGSYDQKTSAAVARWYEARGFEPFGPTVEQVAVLRTLEQDLGEARKLELAAAGAAASAALSVEAARAAAEHDAQLADNELAARLADQARLASVPGNGKPLAVEAAEATAQHADTAARADVAANIADRALVVLDPRQPETARAAAEARLALARAAAEKTALEGELAVQTAEREAQLAAEQLALAETAARSARLAGELAVRAALDAQKVAELDARLAKDRADRLAADLAVAKSRVGVQLPADEIVFLPTLPVRVHEITALVGNVASGPVLSVTDNQPAVDSGLPLDAAALVKAGMPVAIDEQALGIQASGKVAWVAETPGTNGVDGYHIYFEVRVDPTPTQLQGVSLRLTIPIESTDGAVTVVPISALSLAADGTSRVQVQREGALEYLTVKPGLSADGFAEVTPIGETLEAGQLVVVGYERPENP
jgi:peptidoglycan hydrolase-like protein with peptidoglycan-binding domain